MFLLERVPSSSLLIRNNLLEDRTIVESHGLYVGRYVCISLCYLDISCPVIHIGFREFHKLCLLITFALAYISFTWCFVCSYGSYASVFTLSSCALHCCSEALTDHTYVYMFVFPLLVCSMLQMFPLLGGGPVYTLRHSRRDAGPEPPALQSFFVLLNGSLKRPWIHLLAIHIRIDVERERERKSSI